MDATRESPKALDLVFLTRGIIVSALRLLWIPVAWILTTLLRILLVITIPVQWLVYFVYWCAMLPINFLARFETLYYYFGSACLMGLVAGTGLYYTTRILYHALRLDDSRDNSPTSVPAQSFMGSQPKSTRTGRTAASYRAERAQKQAEQAWNHLRLNDIPVNSNTPSGAASPAELKGNGSWGWTPGGGMARYPLSPAVEKKGLLSTTIFEEEDSSDYTTI